jgi:hypothetical protein
LVVRIAGDCDGEIEGQHHRVRQVVSIGEHMRRPSQSFLLAKSHSKIN